MSEHGSNPGSDDPAATCLRSRCQSPADFWWFDRDVDRWRPVCHRHAPHLHPSIELHAWLESGYMKPVELGKPTGTPPKPREDRAATFREEIDETLGWTE